jgi:hypothetical protein
MKKHRQAYLQGNINRFVLVRNILFEIFGLLVGIGVGVLMRQAKDRFAKMFL